MFIIFLLLISSASASIESAGSRFEEITDKELEIDAQLEIIQSIERAEEELPRKKKKPIDKEKAEELAKDLASADLELRGLRDELVKLKVAYVSDLASGKLDSEVEDDKLVREIQRAYCNPVLHEFSRSEWQKNYESFITELADRSRGLVNALQDSRLAPHERDRLQSLLRENFWAVMLVLRTKFEGLDWNRTVGDRRQGVSRAFGSFMDSYLYAGAGLAMAGSLLGSVMIGLSSVAIISAYRAPEQVTEIYPPPRLVRFIDRVIPFFTPLGSTSTAIGRFLIPGRKRKLWHDFLNRSFLSPTLAKKGKTGDLLAEFTTLAGVSDLPLDCKAVMGSLSGVQSAIEDRF